MAPAIRSWCGAAREEALGHAVNAGERGGALLAVSKFLRLAIQAAVMGVGAYLALRQEISGSILFAASLIMGRALAPMEALVAQWRSFVSMRSAYARLHRMFADAPPAEARMRLPAPTGAV